MLPVSSSRASVLPSGTRGASSRAAAIAVCRALSGCLSETLSAQLRECPGHEPVQEPGAAR